MTFHKKSGSQKKPTSTNTTHVAEGDSDLEEGIFGVQEDLGDEESVLGLISVEPLDKEKEDDDGTDWFSVTDKVFFEDVWNLEKS